MAVHKEKEIVRIGCRKYSYENMRADIWNLWNRYRRILDVRILEKTLDQRNIYCIRLGSPVAPKCIVVNAAIHGREWLNTQLMMLSLEHCCRAYYVGSYHGKRYRQLFEEVCVYLLPMMNPDGVAVSQYGTSALRNQELREGAELLAGKKSRFWKANARGVDLNRNFDSGFGENTVAEPASMEYGGEEPLSEPETRALVRLVEDVKPVGVVNYHEAGSLIYYTSLFDMLFAVQKETGYPLKFEKGGCPGSFGDWLTDKGIGWCTVETCRGKAPVGHWQIYPSYMKNYRILAVAAAGASGEGCITDPAYY